MWRWVVYPVPVICMLKPNDVMLASMDAETVRVRVAWTTSLGAIFRPSWFQFRLMAENAAAGVQLVVLMVRVASALPPFLT